jgi:hypothetical protein
MIANLTHFLHHWVYQDIWVPVWPNLLADVIVGTSLYIGAKRLLQKFHLSLDKNNTELKDLMSKINKVELPNIKVKKHYD